MTKVTAAIEDYYRFLAELDEEVMAAINNDTGNRIKVGLSRSVPYQDIETQKFSKHDDSLLPAPKTLKANRETSNSNRKLFIGFSC